MMLYTDLYSSRNVPGMKRLAVTKALAQYPPWTCPRCLHHRLSSNPPLLQIASFTTKTKRQKRWTRPPRTLVVAAAGGTAAVGLLTTLSDDAQYAYAAAQRTGRVAVTLAVCINEFVHPVDTAFAH